MNNIDMDIADTIMQRPHSFSIGKFVYNIHPVTLGKHYILMRYFDDLSVNKVLSETNSDEQLLLLIRSKKYDFCHILSLYCAETKEDVFNNVRIVQRAKFFEKQLSEEEICTLFITCISMDDLPKYYEYLGIDKERQRMAKVIRAKKDKSDLTFGGKSIYGTLLDHACERYGWTLDYVVWGISYVNLQLMLADNIQSIYLTDEEKKRAHISDDGINLSGDTQDAIDIFKQAINYNE